MRRFVIGDIHGSYKALVQCFERSAFDFSKDRLIVLGDVCDGYPDVRQCIDELLKIRQCDYVIGNHDLWALQWAEEGIKKEIWLNQGGANTIVSYGDGKMVPEHVDFLAKAQDWIELENMVFVHGGFDPARPLKEQDLKILVWDRALLYSAEKRYTSEPDFQYGGYRDIFIGHTTTEQFGSFRPLHFCNVWAMDTGAGWGGVLTIMDIDTKEYWQSDFSRVLYGMSLRF